MLAASNRMPVALALVNRTLSGPLNINCDHTDGMGARDTGWIQIYAENNQEAYDNFIQAYPIAEHPDVRLPIMICQDGFITSHAVENIELLEDAPVKEFVGTYEPEEYLLNPGKPMAVGPYAISPYVMEARKAQLEALNNSKAVVAEVGKKFGEISGREYGFFEEYKLDDAEYIMVIMGSAAGTAKEAVDRLRAEGRKVGILKLRLFRPFPAEEIAEALKDAKAVAIMDRCEPYNGNGGVLGNEICAGLYKKKYDIPTVNYIYGLGGRDFTVEHTVEVFDELKSMAEENKTVEQYRYIGIRG